MQTATETPKVNETITKEGVAYYVEVVSFNDHIEGDQRFMANLYSPSGDWLEAKDYKSLRGARNQASKYLDLVTY